MTKKNILIFLLLNQTIIWGYFCFPAAAGDSAQSQIIDWLNTIPYAEVNEIKSDSLYNETFEILLSQPLDHNNPGGEIFKQRIFLSHIDVTQPVVIITEGYSADKNYTSELSKILKANQIIVEHRFFGKSKPDSLDWEYLTVLQAAADHHKIISLFKQMYKGKWISTGISKGGQTAMYHKRYYPEDVDATVTYVAPLNLSEEDPRINAFLNSAGEDECRKKIKEFQRGVLLRQNEILPLFYKDAEERNYVYSLGAEKMFEYIALEYSFAFWQWGYGNCSGIPKGDTTAGILFEHLKTVVPFYYYSDTGIKNLQPFFYQAYTELGYYSYDITDFKDLLIYVTDPTNKIFTPPNAEIVYICATMHDINNWLQTEGNNILYIYGELDTWSATSVQLIGRTNAIKMVKKGGAHSTRIRHFKGEEKERIYSTLENWLGLTIQR